MILFLDIDGCLRREDSPKYQLEAHLLENLSRFVEDLEKQSPVEIVITSTWKTAFSLDEIRGHFPEELRLKVIGDTPSFPAADGSRYEEILAYLKDNGLEEAPWIAIDDDPLAFPARLVEAARDPATRKNLILCDPQEGFLFESPRTPE